MPDSLPQTALARRIDSRRFSIGPSTVYVESSTRNGRFYKCLSSFYVTLGNALAESGTIAAFGLVVVWITYFAGAMEREWLFVASGTLAGLLLLSTLFKRRKMLLELDRHSAPPVRRPFPRGAIVRSGSRIDVTPEDKLILDRIRASFLCILVQDSVTTVRHCPTVPGNSCVICLLEYSPGEVLFRLLCDHRFHPECLIGWFRAQIEIPECRPNCPTCRSEVKVSDNGMEAFMREVCDPRFLGPHLSQRVHIVFDRDYETPSV
jgi:hypothetical protein